MLYQGTVIGEQTVFIVPQGTRAFIYIDMFSEDPETELEIKINDLTFWKGYNYEFMSIKLALTENDTIKIKSNKEINVFIHGILI